MWCLQPSDLFSDPHDELGIIGSGLPWDLVGELEGAQHAFDHDDEDESDDLNTSLEAGSLLDAVTDTSVSTPMASELMAHLVSPTTPLITSPVKSLVTVMAPAVTTVTPLGTTTQLATSVKPVGTNSATPLAKVVTSDVLNDEIEGAILTAEDLLGFDGKLECKYTWDTTEGECQWIFDEYLKFFLWNWPQEKYHKYPISLRWEVNIGSGDDSRALMEAMLTKFSGTRAQWVNPSEILLVIYISFKKTCANWPVSYIFISISCI